MNDQKQGTVSALSIFHHLTIDNSLESVWSVFGERSCPWFSKGGAEYDNRLGGFLTHPELKMRAEVTHFAHGRRVVWQLYVDDNLGTTVEFQFAWDGERTHLTFREDGWEQVPAESRQVFFDQSKQSWLSMLENLKRIAEEPMSQATSEEEPLEETSDKVEAASEEEKAAES